MVSVQGSSPWGPPWPISAFLWWPLRYRCAVNHPSYSNIISIQEEQKAKPSPSYTSDVNHGCWSVWFLSFAECLHGPKPRPTGVNYRTAPLASPACDWPSFSEQRSTLGARREYTPLWWGSFYWSRSRRRDWQSLLFLWAARSYLCSWCVMEMDEIKCKDSVSGHVASRKGAGRKKWRQMVEKGGGGEDDERRAGEVGRERRCCRGDRREGWSGTCQWSVTNLPRWLADMTVKHTHTHTLTYSKLTILEVH